MTTSERISSHCTAQPMDGNGYVFAQAAWLDDVTGDVYSLALPDRVTASPVRQLKPLYVCLGQWSSPVADRQR